MIARVFPTRTSMSPTDDDAYFDEPDMFCPQYYQEVHVSCTFTWDLDRAEKLTRAWKRVCPNVKLGGVAVNGESQEPFKAGMYLRHGITITSRGCPNNCSFCIIKNPLREFDEFPEGNIVQDNNILACSDRHRRSVFQMLRGQSNIEFKGGLESSRVTPQIAEELRSLKIRSLWLACDHDGAIKPLRKAVEILKKAGFKRYHLYCFVLIGKEENRLREVFDMGLMPFAQLYQPTTRTKIEYTKRMKQYARTMSRPAATRTVFKETT